MKKIIPLFLLLNIFIVQDCFAYVSMIKNGADISYDLITKLARIGKTKGSSDVAKELALISDNVPVTKRAVFYEAAYTKILVEQNRISKIQADEWHRNLSGIPGYRNTLSKMCGTSIENTVGHRFELDTANSLVKNNFSVIEIGKKFNDGRKLGSTDIDIIAIKEKTTYIFELKNYNRNNFDFETINKFSEDMMSLKSYATQNINSVPIMIIKNKPADRTFEQLIKAHGQHHGVKIIYGEPIHAIQRIGEMAR